ncbi:glycosyltransferase [Streptomyces sp. NPDC059680]|uniref:glycosyltransferase n=1 Tax=Streptomyces sp. NPDC059680 TaxID=3346904 RepID=UPI0036AE943F
MAGALSVAEHLGIPSVAAFHDNCAMFPSPHRPPLTVPGNISHLVPLPPGVNDNQALWDLNAQGNQVVYGEALNTNRKSIGLPPVDNFRDYVVGDRPWLASDPILDLWYEHAPELDVVQTGVWFLSDTRKLPDDLENFLNAGSPPVYVGFGSAPMRTSPGVVRVAVEAVRAQGYRLLLSRGWADLALADDGKDCFIVGEVNHHDLFGRVAAVVHHGGAGTLATAARAGAPQVVVAQYGDQTYWAGRVAKLGLGAAHDGPTPTSDSLSDAIEVALSPRICARASSMASAIRTDGATVAANLLLGEH